MSRPTIEIDLLDALDGLYAYDMGCTDSGTSSHEIRRQVKAALKKDPKIVDEYIKTYLTVENGYGQDTWEEFRRWLEFDLEVRI